VRKAGNLPPSCAVVTKARNLNFPETSGPVQACNGTVLPPVLVPVYAVFNAKKRVMSWKAQFLTFTFTILHTYLVKVKVKVKVKQFLYRPGQTLRVPKG